MRKLYLAACAGLLAVTGASAQSVFDAIVPEAEPKTQDVPPTSCGALTLRVHPSGSQRGSRPNRLTSLLIVALSTMATKHLVALVDQTIGLRNTVLQVGLANVHLASVTVTKGNAALGCLRMGRALAGTLRETHLQLSQSLARTAAILARDIFLVRRRESKAIAPTRRA
jgi:hypothetical protein